MIDDLKSALSIGHQLEGYDITGLLGHGGFGITYLARHQRLQTEVAIKEYLPHDIAVRENGSTVSPKSAGGDSDFFEWGMQRFLEEAQTVTGFKHPNIVRVRDFFEANGTAYMVMDYEPGAALDKYLDQQQKMLEEDLLTIFLPVLDGMREVHSAGFLHRDIKPANIYIRSNATPMLIDFGSARLALGERSRSLSVVVSEGYAPKEQYTSRGNHGPWTDIYGLGASLYRCISGKTPCSAVDRVEARDEDEPDPLIPAVERGKGRYSTGFLQAIDQSLALLSKNRPQTVREFQGLLQGAGDEENGSEQAKQQAEARRQSKREAEPVSESKIEADTPTERHGISWWWAVIVCVLVFGGLYQYGLNQDKQKAEEDRQARLARLQAEEDRQSQQKRKKTSSNKDKGLDGFLESIYN